MTALSFALVALVAFFACVLLFIHESKWGWLATATVVVSLFLMVGYSRNPEFHALLWQRISG